MWVAPDDVPGAAGWMAGGSYLVARRIRMHIEVWDRTPLMEQEQVIGRDKKVGAPLGRTAEFDEPDFAATGMDGGPRIPANAHVRLAHHSNLAASASCAGATPSPTAPTARATSTPGCSSSPSCATRTGSSCRCSGRWPGPTG